MGISLGLATGGEGTQLDPIIGGILTVNRDNGYLGYLRITFAQVVFESLCVFDIGERADLESIIQALADRLNLVRAAVDDFEAHRDRSTPNHLQGLGSGVRKVDNSSFGEGAAVVDGDLYGFSINQIGDPDPCAEG